MRSYLYLLLFLFVIVSCKEDEEQNQPQLPKNYGNGMYVLTDQGVSYFDLDYKNISATVKNNIYYEVNKNNILNPKSITISGNQAFIIGDKLYVADIETFGELLTISGFVDPVSCVKVDNHRVYVVDRGDATVKAVDLEEQKITNHFETGENTHPVKIVNNWFRALVMNGGGNTKAERDSFIVCMDYFTKYDFVEIDDFSGKLDLGYNPVSAVFGTNELWVLCKGIFDENNPSNNTIGRIYQVYPYSTLSTFFNKALTGIYNADNLCINKSKNRLFFTAENGIYISDLGINPVLHVAGIKANTLAINTEQINDSTWAEYLYANDENQSGKVFKFDAWTGTAIDTINVNGNILEIAFH